MSKNTSYILSILIALSLGFYLGKKLVEPLHTIEYIEGKTIEKIVEVPKPYEVIKPSDPIYIYKEADTIYQTQVAQVDTLAILHDWITKRNYTQLLFDDDNGKLSIQASVQYNNLQELKYKYAPIQKEIRTQNQAILTPYVGVSYSSLNHIGIGGGIFYHNLGIGAKYITDFDRKGFDFELKYKF